MTIMASIAAAHDLGLIALAGVACAAGSWVTIRLFTRARAAQGGARVSWLFLNAVVAGASAWTTHVVATLAYDPGAPVSVEAIATIYALMIMIAGSFIGFSIASSRRLPLSYELGGATVGASIAGMHYLGMAGYDASGPVTWNMGYVSASVALAVLLGSLSLNRIGRPFTSWYKYGAAALLALAIAGLHAVGLAAMTVPPSADGTLVSSNAAAMAFGLGCIGLLVIGMGFASYRLDARNRADAYLRLRNVANATIEGLLVEENGRIIEVNDPFEKMVGLTRDAIVSFYRVPDLFPRLDAHIDAVMAETKLHSVDGSLIDVEVLVRDDLMENGKRVLAIRDIRQRLAQESRIRHLAQNDALTGLPNRVTFAERLDRDIARMPATGRKLAVVSFDLNNFKDVNDLRGHRAGDEVLQILAARLMDNLGDDEFVARIGGDEFSAIKLFSTPNELTGFVERLEMRLSAPVPFPDAEVVTGASIGISVFPDDGNTRETLVNNADLAMYRAKLSPTQSCIFYEESMEEAMRERRQLAKDLRAALDLGQFELRYQVQNAISTGEVTGYEVLLRWKHPDRGYIPPLDFIPIAEETGLILPIGEWVLRTACATAAAWENQHRIAVNLSPIQLTQADLPRLVHQILFDTGLSGSRLELEVTESVMMTDPERAKWALRQIKALGVTIAMDDFGTGFSSLSTLQAFPFDKIKLDRSFMMEVENNPQAKAIIRAVLALGRSLDIPVLAEGVETEEQLKFLNCEGCDEAQGYLLGRPVPLDDLHFSINGSVSAVA
jgi:diguanylate cyclase (GGDEF)-like protein